MYKEIPDLVEALYGGMRQSNSAICDLGTVPGIGILGAFNPSQAWKTVTKLVQGRKLADYYHTTKLEPWDIGITSALLDDAVSIEIELQGVYA